MLIFSTERTDTAQFYEEVYRINSQQAAVTIATPNRLAVLNGPAAAAGADGNSFTLAAANNTDIDGIFVTPSAPNADGSQLWHQGLNYTTGITQWETEGPIKQLGDISDKEFTQDLVWQCGFAIVGLTGPAAGETITITNNGAGLTAIGGAVTSDASGVWAFYPNSPQVTADSAANVVVTASTAGVLTEGTNYEIRHAAFEITVRRRL